MKPLYLLLAYVFFTYHIPTCTRAHAHTHTYACMHIFIQDIRTVKPAHLLTYCDSRRQTRTFALPPGFCPERGLKGKPQHSSEEQESRGKPITNTTHAALAKYFCWTNVFSFWAQAMFEIACKDNNPSTFIIYRLVVKSVLFIQAGVFSQVW